MNYKNNTFQSNEFTNYLSQYKAEKGCEHTNTRIGDKELNIYGGIYNIPYDDEFWNEYHKHIFINNQDEYLTEKQLLEDGPLLIDIDLRYTSDIITRQHSEEHILDLLELYFKELSKIYDFDNEDKIDVYIFEKPSINVLNDKSKDGIHIIFSIQMHKAVQCLFRKKVMNEIKTIWSDINNTNSIDEVFDEGITKGFVNWQLFGSKKPNNEAYGLTYYYSYEFIKDENNWNLLTKHNIQDKLFKIINHLPLISARYNKHKKFNLKNNEYLLKSIEEETKNINSKYKKNMTSNNSNSNSNATCITEFDDLNLQLLNYSKISSQQELDKILQLFLNSLCVNDYEIKETHYFTMVLPESYYGEGSYNKWIRVGWALKNTHDKLFLTWVKFSSQSKTFDFKDIKDMYSKWKTFDYKNPDALTNRSIMFWSKNDNYSNYIKIRQETISFYIDQTLETIVIKDKVAEFDLATVLYQLCKDQFICVNVKNNQWYEYKNNKWHEIDSGNTLRLIISKKMHDLYMKKANDLIETVTIMESNDQNTDSLKLRSSKLGDICILLKTTSWKNNIMKEAKDLFYDSEFLNKLDSNPYLLCFNNYIIDFKNKLYRKGKPDDYISKSTNIEYIPYDNLTSKYYTNIISEINTFFDQLFPDEELRKYMWQHLASCLVGTNDNQTFNIYTGSGCNGKSKLVELIGKCLGDYKATVPITLITQTRNSIGSTSPEIVQLVGVRYAVMQEPSKGEKINEGIMKEITGGDPIQARALFKDTITFIPQFKLVVCTNVLFDIKSNDDGTWRRVRVCDFMSKFNDNPYENETKYPRSNFPYQYVVDRKIDEKFELWAPVLASMLTKIAFETGGKVEDAKIVTAVSDKYREGQDYLTEFAKEKISRRRDSKIKKTEVMEEFKNWYIMHYGRNNLPNGKEITDYMDKNYGKNNKGKWLHVEIIYNDDDDDDDNDQVHLVE